MNNLQKKYVELRSLISESEEGSISFEGMQRLNDILLNDPHAREYYREYIHITVILKSLYTNEQISFHPSKEFDSETDYFHLFNQFAEYEKNAPAINISKEEPQQELIKKVVYPPREKYKMSNFNRLSLIACAGVILFFLLLLRFAPQKPSSVDVATLVDCSNVQWAQPDNNINAGSRLWACEEPLSLEKGVIQIEYDYGAIVTVESPATFRIDSRESLVLSKGRLHIRALDHGKGFKIKTPSSVMVDIGTEFGVEVNSEGDSQLHVFKGNVILSVGSKQSKDKQSRKFSAGQAVEVRKKDLMVRSIPIQQDYQDVILTSEVVSYWNLDESANASAFNDLAENNDGVAGNSGIVSGVPGKFGNAVKLDGSNKNAFMATTANMPFGRSLYSVSYWVNIDTFGGFATHYGYGQMEYGKFNGGIHKQDAVWHIYWRGDKLKPISIDLSSSEVFRENQWHFVVMLWNGVERQIWVDGVKVAVDKQAPNTVDKEPFRLGHDARGDEVSDFIGKIDDVAVWKVALDAEDIAWLWNDGKGRPAGALHERKNSK